MVRKKNHIGGLLDSLNQAKVVPTADEKPTCKESKSSITNPAVKLAMGSREIRAKATREAILELDHDQVIFFKYHDRHVSSLDTAKVAQIRKSIESEGQHFPGVVRKTDKFTKDGRLIYELIVGRVRYEASRTVGFFKAFLKDLDDADAAKLMLSENEDRLDITPFERWLSVLPLVDDKVLSNSYIASSIGWDKGNFSRSMKARAVYEELSLSDVLVDVSKVKLSLLIDLATKYESEPSKVKSAVMHIKSSYPSIQNNRFLKAVDKHIKDAVVEKTKTVYLDGSKLKIKRTGDNVSMNFTGLPNESNINEIISALKDIDALK